MSEQPVEGPEEGYAAERDAVARRQLRTRLPRPGVVFGADLLPALSVLSLVTLLGFPLGWIWARLAPPQESTMTRDGELVPVLVESYHGFDGLAVFLLLSSACGVLVAAAVWQLRGRRGPVLLVATALGSLLSAWLGMRLGTSFAAGMYPVPDTLRPGDLVTVAPRLGTWVALLGQPLTGALTYGLLVSWNGLDDLGRRRG
ncbi:Protein of unknown function [Actinopolyspora mzabensis]|uniref:DUF2567 domain-containing protein n=1 Tax=Actinopolyspora mzabensis TaxID=995066 RepID=A0A1G8YXX9_ACTMZ|nr:DUF2567 domain-containing protein [Actinopolyspora mzabensis]SDK07646.1 Protein of unknown function [Actinopolyspora mzabensis]